MWRLLTIVSALVLFAAACGSDADSTTDTSADATTAEAGSEDSGSGNGDSDDAAAQDTADEAVDETSVDASGDVSTVVVTTNILGDVVSSMVGGAVEVVTIMPVGADPHDFSPSAQQIAQMGDADALIVNGASFEEGLLDVIESAEDDGVLVYEAISAVSTIEYGEDGHDDHGHGDEHDHDDEDEHKDDEDHDEHDHDDEEGHDDEDEHDHDDEEGHDDHDDHEGHDHSGEDPHFFTDPARMAVAADGILDFLVDNLDGVDTAALTESGEAYIAELEAIDAEIESTLARLSEDQRVLITNHEVYGYFADRYDFEVVGVVIPGGSTSDSVDAQALAELAETIEDEGVPAIFSDTSSSDELIETLAAEVGDIDIVELFTESLGDAGSGGETYLEMVQSNAERIASALG